METKVCSICKIEKPLSAFYPKYDNQQHHFRAECKGCSIKQGSDPRFYLFWHTRARNLNKHAKSLSIDEKVSVKELRAKFSDREDYYCYWCGKKIDATEYAFDHLIPLSRGGHNRISNIELCCVSCNRLKNTKTSSEFLALIQHIASHHNLLTNKG